jgi:hypothetical protein
MRCVAAVIAFAGITVLVSTSRFPRFVKLLDLSGVRYNF